MRKILHADCDCFYAAVEMRDDPSLSDIPLAIGGRAAQRGVVATCNYPARRFGIHSAMSMAQAVRLCPHLHILPPDFDRYRRVSAQIQTIFHELTPLVEPLSLDEAYLDVSDIERFHGSATWMARWLKRRIYEQVGIIISIGVAPNKFLAKIASDWDKPDGLFVISPDQTDHFIANLPIDKLHGVGPATTEKLHNMEIRTCSDLQRQPLAHLLEHFGKFGARLHELSRGIDERPVKLERERKSISVETTFDRDLKSLEECRTALAPLLVKLDERIERNGRPALQKLFVKIRFDDFSLTTFEIAGTSAEAAYFLPLLEQAWQRSARPVRLLGAGVRLTPPEAGRQISLFD
ncbi:DNA polymerase IV [Kushneria phosphatilytica]|uniref:DNA polymerase IV n=1 Tax=Kushneria phosphatilytica TaxID=657387 RepID=A0A5C1A0Q5_9GAMM|nr:DNA polymerase IV [Kushneria phosphatilytica]QEL11253.1 DNA polymerase IV [Kushneria phosphatilytica]